MPSAIRRSSWAGHRRAILGAIVALVVTAAPACGGRSASEESACAHPKPKVVTERRVDVSYQGPVRDTSALMAAPTPRLVVQVTNSQPSVERVRLAFDGVNALDVDLPAKLGCGLFVAPVFSIAYDLRPGPVEVQLDLQGASSTSTIDVPGTGTGWAVVDVQSKREWGDVTVYDSQPGWG